jgi:hypothetical protein
MRRTPLALTFIALIATACATVEIRETRVLEGRITDDSGHPVAGSPVVVVGRSLNLVTTRLEYKQHGQQEARALTDREGRYRLEFIPSTLGNNFYLFFYDRTGFDSVRYRTPEPIEITDLLRRERRVSVDQVLLSNQTWPEVARQIAFYGEDSDRGRVLRRHGLPEKREGSATLDAEIWRYETQGITYWFAGGRLVDTKTVAPPKP